MATFHEVQKAIRAYAGGIAAANRLVEKVAGTVSLADIDPAKYGAILRALEGEAHEDRGANDDGEMPFKVATEADLEPSAIYARWNSPRRAPHD